MLERMSTALRRTVIHASMSEEQRKRYLETHPFERERLERAFRKRLRKMKARHALVEEAARGGGGEVQEPEEGDGDAQGAEEDGLQDDA